MPLAPEEKQLLDSIPDDGPELFELGVEGAREALATMLTTANPEDVANVENRTFPGPAGTVPIRIYTPAGDGPHPALVFFHGGGWVLGNLETVDGPCRSLTNQARCVVVSVDYRLAPEDKFPACLDDCAAAVRWVADNADSLGIDKSRIAIGGDSAGGNLSATVALKNRDEGGPSICHQLLIYPVTDSRMNTPSYSANGEGYFLSAAAMNWFWEQYLNDASEGANPLASPIRASDFSNLPPATVITAEFDPLRDEGEAYAEQLAAAGVPVESKRWDGTIHGFFGMPDVLPKGKEAIEYAAGRLRRGFGTS